jgi:hypothetical protein
MQVIRMMKTEETLAMIGGHVDEELLLHNGYLAMNIWLMKSKWGQLSSLK